jgi:hypothetical protein
MATMVCEAQCPTAIRTERAEQNRSYVHALLARNNPEFAAALEVAVQQLAVNAGTTSVMQNPLASSS